MMFRKTLLRFLAKLRKAKQEGVALIVSLFVLMVLILLGLSLALQSQSEYIMSVNENDSIAALGYAEAGVDWALRKIKDEAAGDLDPVLQGIDNAPGGGDDGIIGIRQTLNTGIALADLNTLCGGGSTTCERTVSVLVNYDWEQDDVEEVFEAFRVGKDDDGDGNWDGPRAIVYARIEDNYDDEANSGVVDFDDEDLRARIRVMVDYPIFVDGNGAPKDPILADRGIARRRIEARLGPAQGVAIRTNKLFHGNGDFSLCGECGGVHSNGDMEFTGGSAQVCADATSSGDWDGTGPGPTIEGDSGGGQPEQFIPTINPYDDRYVPSYLTFDHSTDAELPTFLQCGPPSQQDPGASKYFALVFKKQNGQHLEVWKAYWDFTAASGKARWLWRKIDDNEDASGALNAVLDNCGRLVSSPDLGLTADPCPTGNLGCNGSGFATQGVSDDGDVAGGIFSVDGLQHCWPSCQTLTDPLTGDDACIPDGIIDACDAGSGDSGFYGIQGQNTYNTETCGSDDSLSGLTENDYNRNDFYLYPDGSANETTPEVPPLPGTFESDNIADFDYSVITQKNRQIWAINTGTIFSPLHNSVLFVFGNFNLNGVMDTAIFRYYDGTISATNSGTAPGGKWRVSMISYGRVEARGTPRFAPANAHAGDCADPPPTLASCFKYGVVAGRDMDLGGGAGSGCISPSDPACNICPDWVDDPTASCEVSNVAPFGYQGIFVAHEQANLSGSSNISGFIVAEEAAYCVEPQPPGEKTRMNGTPDIFYDCEDPKDPWLSEALRIRSWEEVQ